MQKLLLTFLFSCLTLIYIKNARAIAIFHPLKPGGNFITTSTLNACSTNPYLEFNTNCNPALFNSAKKEGLTIFAVAKADGDAIDNTQKLILEPISEDFLRTLFENDSFNSFTLNTDIQFLTNFFHLSYSPFYLMGDIYICNPAFSHVTTSLANVETLKITSGFSHMISIGNTKIINQWGFSLSYQEMDYSNSSFSLIDLGVKEPEELISFSSKHSTQLDIGHYIDFQGSWFPTLSFQIKNIFSEFKNTEYEEDSAEKLAPIIQFETYSLAGIGKHWNTQIGSFHAEVLFPFSSYFEDVYSQYISSSFTYSIGLLSFLTGFSKYHQVIGAYFQSSLSNIGISYSWEQDLGEYSNIIKKGAYLSMEFNL